MSRRARVLSPVTEFRRTEGGGGIFLLTTTLPALAALGGMAVPAAIFLAVVDGGEASRGWAIPMATDIALVVGALALLGPRVPAGLKVFPLTLVIMDDMGAITVIALFYSSGLSAPWLAATVATLGAIVLLPGSGCRGPSPTFLWAWSPGTAPTESAFTPRSLASPWVRPSCGPPPAAVSPGPWPGGSSGGSCWGSPG